MGVSAVSLLKLLNAHQAFPSMLSAGNDSGEHLVCVWLRHYTGREQCLRLKSSMPFIGDLALQFTPLSKEPFKMQPQVEKEDIT